MNDEIAESLPPSVSDDRKRRDAQMTSRLK
jgi:hypothetical protein